MVTLLETLAQADVPWRYVVKRAQNEIDKDERRKEERKDKGAVKYDEADIQLFMEEIKNSEDGITMVFMRNKYGWGKSKCETVMRRLPYPVYQEDKKLKWIHEEDL